MRAALDYTNRFERKQTDKCDAYAGDFRNKWRTIFYDFWKITLHSSSSFYYDIVSYKS